VEIPYGYAGFVHPRSGLAARVGLSMVNAPGTIDAGYRGEILVNLINLDPAEPIVLHRGDRIAQLIVQQVASCAFVEVNELGDSARDTGGHGSTGGAMAIRDSIAAPEPDTRPATEAAPATRRN
jgi:dUTP pyrophosphatase